MCQINVEEHRREINEVTLNIIGKNREIIEEEESICIEETKNSESENQINSANNQIVDVFLNIAQVSSPQTGRIK